MAEKARLGPVSMGTAIGAVYAAFMFLLGTTAYLFGWGAEVVGLLSSIYLGFSATPVGSITGAFWGAADGFIIGYLLAWIYNRMLERR